MRDVNDGGGNFLLVKYNDLFERFLFLIVCGIGRVVIGI